VPVATLRSMSAQKIRTGSSGWASERSGLFAQTRRIAKGIDWAGPCTAGLNFSPGTGIVRIFRATSQ
jgi:hypothetical protein